MTVNSLSHQYSVVLVHQHLNKYRCTTTNETHFEKPLIKGRKEGRKEGSTCETVYKKETTKEEQEQEHNAKYNEIRVVDKKTIYITPVFSSSSERLFVCDEPNNKNIIMTNVEEWYNRANKEQLQLVR